MKVYWHDLPDFEKERYIAHHVTIGTIMDTYVQPDWCSYPDALAGEMGCWSLMPGIRTDISREDCKMCDLCLKCKEER